MTTKYLYGVAAYLDLIVPGQADGSQPAALTESSAFASIDLNGGIPICMGHDMAEAFAWSGKKNAWLWIDDGKLMYEVAIDDSSRYYRWVQDGTLKGSSINFTVADSEWRRIGDRLYAAVTRVAQIHDVGPSPTGLCPYAYCGVSDNPQCPEWGKLTLRQTQDERLRVMRQQMNRLSSRKPSRTLQARSAGKRPKQLMNIGPMPRGMVAGYAIAEAAVAGKGVELFGRTLSASVVKGLVAGGQQAIV